MAGSGALSLGQTLLLGFLGGLLGVINQQVDFLPGQRQLHHLGQDRAYIRTGKLKESNLVARKLGEDPMLVVASPAYVARHGLPRTPQELSQHNLLAFNFRCQNETWPFLDGAGGTVQVAPQGNTCVSDGESMRQLVLAGMGLGRFSRQHVLRDIQQGDLIAVLQDYNPGDRELVHAVFVGPGLQVPARVRVMLDYLLEKVRLG